MGAISRLPNVRFFCKKRLICKNINKTRDFHPRGGKGGGQQRGGGSGGQQRGIDFYFKSEKSGAGLKHWIRFYILILRLNEKHIILGWVISIFLFQLLNIKFLST